VSAVAADDRRAGSYWRHIAPLGDIRHERLKGGHRLQGVRLVDIVLDHYVNKAHTVLQPEDLVGETLRLAAIAPTPSTSVRKTNSTPHDAVDARQHRYPAPGDGLAGDLGEAVWIDNSDERLATSLDTIIDGLATARRRHRRGAGRQNRNADDDRITTPKYTARRDPSARRADQS
jgi:hypothetical protein